MSEIRTLLERKRTELHAPAGSFERLILRRDRKRRNQRIAAGVVGIAVFVAAVLIVTSVGSLDRSKTSVVPGGGAAVDEEFRGLYRVIARQTDGFGCPVGDYRHQVHVHYISEKVRQFGNPVGDLARVFEYVRGERFPWQTIRGQRYVLRYDPATDSAVGVRGPGPQQCTWHVRLVPIGIVAAGQSAGSVDDGFRGWYRVIGRREVGGCSWGEDFRDRVNVRYVDAGVRRITHAGLVYNQRLRYEQGERFPWQSQQHGRSWELRYNPAEDRAVGTRGGLETCLWRVRFVSIG